MQKLDEVYYFPIMEGKEVRLIISVYKVGENWNATIAKGFSDELNSLECANFLLFRKKGMIYAELETGRKVIFEDEWLNEESSEFDNFKIEDEIDKNSNIIKAKSLAVSTGAGLNEPFLVNTSTKKTLNMAGCLVNQKDSKGKARGVCWAACVASIVRYKNGASLLTAEQVCKKMDVGLDAGANIFVVKSALGKYGLS